MNNILLCKTLVWVAFAIPYSSLVWVTIQPFWQPVGSCRHIHRKPVQQVQQPMPELPQLAAMAASGFAAMPTAEQLEEEKRVDDEQVALAKEWLDDVKIDKRIMGAEQLAAYPTEEAAIYLLSALKNDSEAEVRAAAAASLSYFNDPNNKLFTALLAALRDSDEEVRFNAFASLQALLDRAVEQPKTIRSVHGKLKLLVRDKFLAEDIKDSIRAYLSD